MSIMTVKDLKKKAPKGEFLAYINKEEAAALKRAGGSGHLVNGIPSFVGSDYSEKGNANTSGYQGGTRGKGGYQGSTGETNKTKSEGGSGSGNFTNAQAATDKTNQEIANRAAIREQIKRQELEKSRYDVGPKKNIFERFGAYSAKVNKNYKQKQLARYQKSKIDELNAKLAGLENFDGYYGDTDENYANFIDNYAPSITEFGTPNINNNFTGTGKYSQEFIDDVLSGKRVPESFAKINSKYPSFAVMAANMIGPKLGAPTTKEELMDIYSGNKTGNSYIGARDFDINFSTGKDMMKIFEPNRYQMLYGDNDRGDGQNQQQYIPYLPPSSTDDVAEEEKEFAYRFGDEQKVGANVLRGYAAEGGIMGTRARRAMGGIMERVDKRQQFFLGGIGSHR